MSRTARKAAIIGGGVIGAGWAARFLLHGWDVSVFDPDPQAGRKICEVLANARRSLPLLTDAQLPPEGSLTYTDSPAAAVADADWIQESVPERLELKRQALAGIEVRSPTSAVVASSTSGFRPSQLQEGCKLAERFLVAHPFNPVYLLPLVELVPGPATLAEIVTAAKQILTELGMKPLVLRREIDAHIADRLLEAAWRESLWLIRDGIATTSEIDDAIRYGFGLRWAQMGMFETYRIAGGEAGMAHFIEQFGPALKWPWTKLTDVPEMTDELVLQISGQSDAQSARYSIRELERIRDDNLIGILRALKDRDWASGALLNEQERRLKSAAEVEAQASEATGPKPAEPMRMLNLQVLPSWIDYNGHMTEHRYLQVFGETSDALLRAIGMNSDYVATGRSYYTAETHIMHLDEIGPGEGIYSTTQILHTDEKRLHLFHRLHAAKDDRLLASAEQMLLHVDTTAGKACAADPELLEKLVPLAEAHAKLARPEAAGRHVGQGRSL